MQEKPKLIVLIPAIKKNVAFNDDLVKKIAGIPLIQRVINLAAKLTDLSNIFLITDSEEIELIATRNSINFFYDKAVDLTTKPLDVNSFKSIRSQIISTDYLLWLSPYSPLLELEVINDAISKLQKSNKVLLQTYKSIDVSQIHQDVESFMLNFITNQPFYHKTLAKDFFIAKSSLFANTENKTINKNSILNYEIPRSLLHINNFREWWVCEKLLIRKRIVFRVVGNKEVGMGHIFRALTLAHEITDHEVMFVCSEEDYDAVTKIAGYDYWLGIFKKEKILQEIINLKPNLVINDMLSTSEEEVKKLIANKIKVLNFEDVGTGAQFANIVINELFDRPVLPHKNILWGRENFFLREEFENAKKHKSFDSVKSILICFGGTDQNNLTQFILDGILNFCITKKIGIHIVVGPGYSYLKELTEKAKHYKNVELTSGTGVISSIMEKSNLAISSNGRTVYELAHMNIPAIIISQNEREGTHHFASKENGFIYVGSINQVDLLDKVLINLKRLVEDSSLRKTLFKNIKRNSFDGNLERVLKLLYSLLR